MNPMRSLLPVVLLAAAAALVATAAPGEVDPQLQAYVQKVGERVARGQAAVGEVPGTFRVREADAPAAGPAGPGVVEVTTALLACLDNEAQLANVLAYEQARSARGEPRTGGSQGMGLGQRIARAAVAGAATAAVGAAVSDALDDQDHIVQAAATGGAAMATLSLVYATWPRRQTRADVRRDDLAVEQGIRAVVTAGYNGDAAIGAWGRITAASPLGGVEGGYGDSKADRKREKAQRAVLRKGKPALGGEVGQEAYRAEVLERLRAR